MRGRLAGFSLNRLVRFLVLLGSDVEIVVKTRRRRSRTRQRGSPERVPGFLPRGAGRPGCALRPIRLTMVARSTSGPGPRARRPRCACSDRSSGGATAGRDRPEPSAPPAPPGPAAAWDGGWSRACAPRRACGPARADRRVGLQLAQPPANRPGRKARGAGHHGDAAVPRPAPPSPPTAAATAR